MADMIGMLAAVRIVFTAVAATLWIFSVMKELWVLSLVAMVVGEFLWGCAGHASIFLASSFVVEVAALLTWVVMSDYRVRRRNVSSVV